MASKKIGVRTLSIRVGNVTMTGFRRVTALYWFKIWPWSPMGGICDFQWDAPFNGKGQPFGVVGARIKKRGAYIEHFFVKKASMLAYCLNRHSTDTITMFFNAFIFMYSLAYQ